MRVLVTGAIGFVGINVVRCLAEEGDQVIAMYRSPPDRTAIDFLAEVEHRVTLVPGDIEEVEGLSALVRDHQIDGIVHAAAITPRLETERAMPARIMRINFMGTLHVLDAARAHGVRRVIYVSSDALYGPIADPTKPVTEDTVPAAENLYGIAKIASEAVCRRYQTLFDMEIAAGRVCATYGPMERETRSRKGMSAIYQVAHAVLKGRGLSVRGLNVVRTWTHVEDIVRALVAMLKAPHLTYSAYNVSYGQVYSLQQVLDVFQKLEPEFRYVVVGEGETADIAYDESRQRGPLDITRLRQDIGYEPRYDLESGVRAYMDWLRSRN
jgi:nucleoside-diphosphate-sugar epimerase